MALRLVSRNRAALAACALIAGCGQAAPAADRGGDAAPPACRDGDPAVQRHGAPCLCCHSDEFGVGGSVDLGGSSVARVIVIDAHGDVADLAPNPFGNFFRHYPMTAPLSVALRGADGRVVRMQSPAPHGDCNACHAAGGSAPPIHGP